MASFYITLPSNSSPTVYPNNTLTNYRVKLPQPISLEGEWEVGLAEIIYPHQWYNIDRTSKYSYSVNGDQWWVKPLDTGFYTDTKAFVKALQTNYPENIEYNYNTKTRKLHIRLAEGARVRFQGRLAEILGFKTATTVKKSLTIENPIDLKHIHNLYVYCDIVESHPVGHSKVPLLRVVNVTGNYGDDISAIFSHIYYHPLKQRYFDTIEIDIRDNTGRNIPFVRGTVIVTVHFRLRRAPQFI